MKLTTPSGEHALISGIKLDIEVNYTQYLTMKLSTPSGEHALISGIELDIEVNYTQYT